MDLIKVSEPHGLSGPGPGHSSKSAAKNASVQGWCQGHFSPRDPFLGPLTARHASGSSNYPEGCFNFVHFQRKFQNTTRHF